MKSLSLSSLDWICLLGSTVERGTRRQMRGAGGEEPRGWLCQWWVSQHFEWQVPGYKAEEGTVLGWLIDPDTVWCSASWAQQGLERQPERHSGHKLSTSVVYLSLSWGGGHKSGEPLPCLGEWELHVRMIQSWSLRYSRKLSSQPTTPSKGHAHWLSKRAAT